MTPLAPVTFARVPYTAEFPRNTESLISIRDGAVRLISKQTDLSFHIFLLLRKVRPSTVKSYAVMSDSRPEP
jgi:hypothetical protein